MTYKPMLACDAVLDKVRFPVLVQPKIDGVRGLNTGVGLTGRSLKQHANKHVTRLFSDPVFIGIDGELAAERETHPDLCRLTTSAVNTIEGEPFVLWWAFDYLTNDTKHLPYCERLLALRVFLAEAVLGTDKNVVATHVRAVPTYTAESVEDLLRFENWFLELGYEGVILRDPNGMHKQGRSTARENGLLRMKRFIEFEVEVLELIEGETNLNEAQVNELGKTFRTTHQENMVPNGMVGSFYGRIVADVIEQGDKVLFKKNETVKIAAGRMTHNDRIAYFRNPDQIVGKFAKCKTFPGGVKDKPRFPTFQSLRSESDM